MAKPVINYLRWQKGDEDVIEACPQHIFEKQNGKVVIVNAQECIGCRSCEIRFPHSIKVIDDEDNLGGKD